MMNGKAIIYLILAVMILSGCAAKDISIEKRNSTRQALADSIIEAIAASDYDRMRLNVLTPVQLHRMIMMKKLEENYSALSAQEKKEYDIQVYRTTQLLQQLDDQFETEFWTVKNIGENNYRINWNAVERAIMKASPVDQRFFHQDVQRMEIRFEYSGKKFMLTIPQIIDTAYGWRLIPDRVDLQEVGVHEQEESEEPEESAHEMI